MYSKRIDWCGVVVAFFLALSVVAMSVLVFLPLTSQNVCFADSSNGIVEDNLLLNNDCSTWSYQPSGSGNDKVLWSTSDQTFYVYTGYGLTVNSNTFVASNTTDLQRIYYVVTGLTVGQTYTFTYYMSSSQGEYRIRVYQDGTNLYSNYNQTAGMISYTFTCTYAEVRLFAQFRGTATIDWFKLELGSSFTGYVPKDYEHYGYNEGYDDGVKYMVDRQLLTNGVELLGSFSIVAFKYGGFSSLYYNYNGGIMAQQGPSLLPPYDSFTYNGNTYSLTGPYPSGSLPPQYFTLLDYDSSDYTMSIYVPAWGNGYWSILPIAYDVQFIGQSIYFTSDFAFGSPYRLIIRSTDGSSIVFVSDFTISGDYNGINFVDLTKYLVSGQSYNFYVTKTSSNSSLSFSTHNSYYTGIRSLCIFTINNAYTVGVNNYNKGYDEGYELGYSRGFSEGDNAGYIRGVDESSDYGFYGMIGSAIDVPINAITGLLDFELLGVNMKAFFLSIFSLAILIVIVRLIVGGLS